MATRAGVGLSGDADSSRAAREASTRALMQAGVNRADWGIVFATGPHRPRYAAVLTAVQECLRTEFLTGCSAWGVIASGEEVEGQPAVAVLAVQSDRIEAETLLAPAGEDAGPHAASEIAVLAGKRSQGVAGEDLLVLLPDPFAFRPELLLKELGRTMPGTPAIGGAAAGTPRADQTFQFYGRNVATRSVAGLYLSGGLQTGIGITQGCQPLGAPCRVTAGGGNLILELDGRPALEVLRSRLPGPLRDELQRLGGHLFVALPPEADQERIDPGEYLVRSLVGADPERGSLAISATIEVGQLLLLVLREGQAARDDLKQMLARVAAAPGRPDYRFGLYFNCAARGASLYGIPGIDSAYISGALPNLPILGLFGNAEIAPLRGSNRFFTHTGVLALVAEVP